MSYAHGGCCSRWCKSKVLFLVNTNDCIIGFELRDRFQLWHFAPYPSVKFMLLFFSRLVAFNLGYLPGGDKKLITRSDTTLLAIEAAQKILMPGGLISIVAYVGHSGGR